jgi:hypothetical protein
VPSGEAGERFVGLAREALPDVDLRAVAGGHDVLFYRETARLPLSHLPQLGAAGQDAYRQLAAVEHFTPHTRRDIAFQSAGLV